MRNIITGALSLYAVSVFFFTTNLHAEATRVDLDVSGADAPQLPPRGPEGADGSGYGGDGWPAPRARSGDDGGNAGIIDIWLETSGNSFRYFGTARGGAFGAPGAIDSRAQITAPILLRARGGNGANGSDGGTGGSGRRGYPGTDATQSTRGTNGGPGGNGGGGGKGGDGGDAGAGGPIRVRSTFKDSYLFSLLEGHDVSAGKPGALGHGGGGGMPGPGGSGGSAKHWTTYTSETVEYTTSDGKRGFTKKDVPHHHTTAGGYTGPSGSPGSRGEDGIPGKPKPNGSFAYIVERDGVETSYSERFNLSLPDYAVIDQIRDGGSFPSFEPDEKGEVFQLKATSSGGMPTPPQGPSETRITLRSDDGHKSNGKFLNLPVSLNVGETYDFKDERLGFKVRNMGKHPVNEQYVSSFTVSPDAEILPVRRRYSEFKNEQTFKVEFPVHIKLDAPPALAPRQRGRVRVHIANTKEIPLGIDVGRALSISIKDDGQAPIPMHFSTVNSTGDGKAANLRQGIEPQIVMIPPHETLTIEGVLEVPAEFEPQSAYTFSVYLNLGLINDPTHTRVIQEETQRVSVASKYTSNPEAEIILINNAETTKEETLAWKELLEDELGFKTSTWNVAYYGNLDIGADTVGQPRFNLMDDFAGRVPIVLNNHFKWYSGDRVTPWEALSKKRFLNAINRYGINFMVVGNVPQQDLSDYVRTEARQGSRIYRTPEAMFRGLEILHRENLDEDLRTRIWNDFHEVSFKAGYYSTPRPEDLEAKAHNIAQELKRRWPNRRYLAVHSFDGSIAKRGSFLGRNTVNLGGVTVQRLPDTNEEVVVAVAASDTEIHSPTFIKGERVLTGFFDALSTSKKIVLFNRLVDQVNAGKRGALEKATLLVDAMVQDLAVEMETASRGAFFKGNYAPLTASQLALKFTSKVQGDSEALVKRLFARASLLCDYSYSGLAWSGTAKTAGLAGKAELVNWAKNAFADPKNWQSAQSEIQKMQADLFNEAKITSWTEVFASNQSKSGRLAAMYSKLMQTPEFQSSTALNQNLVMSQSEFEAIAAKSDRDYAEWEALNRRNREARAELKLPQNAEKPIP